ncbi:hypothetical protein [Candidatus Nitrosocosmicus franklandus]|uniref:Uncharacterized protein n=1 Tax=Candidatus Nitrosocosmicus franklandianus TaxID=1798806 RepID=A0A484I8L3_9ARCH|nr:hypothetical protein [Candidatus Nitrosocosmicus franklandus]VFJ12624.1 exported protein of unknown function [Candidatus Nitrosocosmicus franklandus]
MNDKQQGALAIVLIAFFIIVNIAVSTPALSGTMTQPADQAESTPENETASANMTTSDISNNTG